MADRFDHAPELWTAAKLRDALSGLPDATPIHIGVADGPGDFDGYGEFVLVDAAPVELDLAGEGSAQGCPAVQFALFADAKAGL
ncbi:DUF6225 family protein [Streptomyces albidochromogenes]|uniref:DUF6225 family protein n=1 Tax=Streptomyces albidochromogenes TaxID=329524 RepID=A0ABW6FHR0_9ACTN